MRRIWRYIRRPRRQLWHGQSLDQFDWEDSATAFGSRGTLAPVLAGGNIGLTRPLGGQFEFVNMKPGRTCLIVHSGCFYLGHEDEVCSTSNGKTLRRCLPRMRMAIPGLFCLVCWARIFRAKVEARTQGMGDASQGPYECPILPRGLRPHSCISRSGSQFQLSSTVSKQCTRNQRLKQNKSTGQITVLEAFGLQLHTLSVSRSPPKL